MAKGIPFYTVSQKFYDLISYIYDLVSYKRQTGEIKKRQISRPADSYGQKEKLLKFILKAKGPGRKKGKANEKRKKEKKRKRKRKKEKKNKLKKKYVKILCSVFLQLYKKLKTFFVGAGAP